LSGDRDLILTRRGEPPSDELKRAAVAQASEVLPGLVVGSAPQCRFAGEKGYHCISVRNEIGCSAERCRHMPYLDLDLFIANQADLDLFADTLRDVWLVGGKKTYVHCFFGVERAPLAVAYAIKRDVTPALPFADVYTFIRRVRQVALDRTAWLERVP